MNGNNPQIPTDTGDTRGSKLLKKLFAVVLVGLLAVYIFINKEDFNFIFSIKLYYLLPVLLLNVLESGLLGYRFYLLLVFISQPIPFRLFFKYYIVGQFINQFLPYGGGVYRAVMLKKAGNISYGKYISTLISFKWTSSVFTVLIAIIVVLFHSPFMKVKGIAVVPLLGLILISQIIIIPVFNIMYRRFSPVGPVTGFKKLLRSGGEFFRQSVKAFENRPLLFSNAVIVVLNIIINVTVFHFFFLSMGMSVDLSQLILFVVVFRLSSVIEITPGNAGGREFMLGFLSQALGAGMAEGIAVSMMWRLTVAVVQGVLSLMVIMLAKNQLKDKNGG